MARMHTRKPCHIALTDNPNHSVIIIHYRQPPDLVARHAPHTTLDRVILVTSVEIFAHALAHSGMARVYPTSNDPERNITIGHHPNQMAVIIDDWQYPTIASAHQTRRALDGLPRINSDHAARHDISRSHIIQVVPSASRASLAITLSITPLVEATAKLSLFIAEPGPDFIAGTLNESTPFPVAIEVLHRGLPEFDIINWAIAVAPFAAIALTALPIGVVPLLILITAMIILNRITFCHLNLLYGYHYFNLLFSTYSEYRHFK
jgi:hypothetical protein